MDDDNDSDDDNDNNNNKFQLINNIKLIFKI